MYSRRQAKAALRARLVTLSVATTGSMSLAAVAASGSTSSHFLRTTGSFLSDGFASGAEVAGTGFSAANNAPRTVTGVSADGLQLYCDGLAAESAGGSRTLTVGLPALRDWEGEGFDPVAGRPYVSEQFVGGPSSRPGHTPGSHMAALPQYAVHFHVPENFGTEGLESYLDAARTLFASGVTMTLANGDNLRVRADVGPFDGQVLRRKAGWITAPITFPLRLYSLNAA